MWSCLGFKQDRRIKRSSPSANRLTTSPAASKSEQLVSGSFAFFPQTKHIHTRALRAARECRDRLQLLGDADLSGIHYTIVNVKVCILLILNLKKKKRVSYTTNYDNNNNNKLSLVYVSEDEMTSLFSRQAWWIVSFISVGSLTQCTVTGSKDTWKIKE